MLESFFKNKKARQTLLVVGLPLWVFLGFMLSQAIVLAVLQLLNALNVPLDSINSAVFSTTASAVIYVLSVALVVAVPWYAKRRPTKLEDLGLKNNGPTGLDFLWTPAGYIVYAMVSSIVLWLAGTYLPFVDIDQAQDTGFGGITQQYEFILAFVSLVIVAPIAEEVLFRGYLLHKLRKRAPLWVAIFITSLTFAVVHFAWNVGFDVFVLSIVLCILRVVTGSLWAPIMLHMLKNGIAFYFLFVNPSFLATLGG